MLQPALVFVHTLFLMAIPVTWLFFGLAAQKHMDRHGTVSVDDEDFKSLQPDEVYPRYAKRRRYYSFLWPVYFWRVARKRLQPKTRPE